MLNSVLLILQHFYAYRIKCFRGVGGKMQGFHISATISLILVMKRHYSLKAVCQKWIGCLIPGHWTTICTTNVLRNRRLEGTTELLMDCQVQLSLSQSTMHYKFSPKEPTVQVSCSPGLQNTYKTLWQNEDSLETKTSGVTWGRCIKPWKWKLTFKGNYLWEWLSSTLLYFLYKTPLL